MNQKNLLILIYYWYRHIMTCEMRLSEYECKAIKIMQSVGIHSSIARQKSKKLLSIY
jgi:hypothetical protein